MEVEILVISAIIIAISIYIYYIRRRVPKAKEPSTFFNTEEKPAKSVGSNPLPQETKSWFSGWKPRRVGSKIKIPGLLTFKRVIAGFLFLVHGIFFLMLLRYPAPMSDYYAFAIFLTCFILLDYLFKTRSGD